MALFNYENTSYFKRKEINLLSIKDNFKLDGSIESKVIAFAFSLCAEIERKLISERTKESLNRLKNEGVKPPFSYLLCYHYMY
ncbi:MAG: recombinase family protein [Firmicutes bacterium]|uniref:Recombinase family protein n=1 Tax=Candidatus Onthovivens merdipullorum TaxID=2840889 RepID=A0A9D9DJQ9_9BACL|nr:recombinase family protein [Candidatus Onthovivens merdipullorum]